MAGLNIFNLLLFCLTIRNVYSACIVESDGWRPDKPAFDSALIRINPLMNITYNLSDYTLAICRHSGREKSAGAVWSVKNKPNVILGRTNRTNAFSSDNWVFLEYFGGDQGDNISCTGFYSTEIIILCDVNASPQGTAELLQRAGCIARFRVVTSALCPLQGHSIFLPILLWIMFLFSMYCLGGVIYRRCLHQARGRNQLPHLPFWSKIGAACANTCDWACRCEPEFITTWDGDTDGDDSLLRPLKTSTAESIK